MMWSKEAIQQFLQDEDLQYQHIALPYGLSTPGTDRKSTCDLIFDEALNGKSVLDIGSFLGYFCLAACERGAGRVVGWEVDAERIRQARTIAEIKGLSIEYRQCDVETTEPQEEFDIVLCLNILHHLFDPIAVLDSLIAHTRETLILEMASLGTHDRRKLGLSYLQSLVLSQTPAIVVGKGSTSPPYNKQQKYFFTKDALLNLLTYHRNYFASVEVHESEFKTRFILIAHKRRVKNLVVVTGPTSSGKTTLIKALRSNACPELAARLGVNDFSSWDSVGAHGLLTYPKRSIEHLIFHYDFLRPYRKSTKTHRRDEALHLLRTADNIAVVTVYTEPERLRRQLISSEFNVRSPSTLKHRLKWLLRKLFSLPGMTCLRVLPGGKRLFKRVFREASERHLNIQRVYQKSENIFAFYRDWFDYIEQLPVNIRHHLIVSTHQDQELTIYTRAEWEAMIRTSVNRRNQEAEEYESDETTD
jgi:2-polyprenyl-3-methyl-5-hydroxy-6-metoxy-1,4-benzoquinol methylase